MKYLVHVLVEDNEITESQLTAAENFGQHPDDSKMTFLAEGCFDTWEEAKKWYTSIDSMKLYHTRTKNGRKK
jgi:hypothetical protein